jgi:hypothetical protein
VKLESKTLRSMVDAYKAEHTLEAAERRALQTRLERIRATPPPRAWWPWSLAGAAAAAALLLLVIGIQDRALRQDPARDGVEASDHAAESPSRTATPRKAPVASPRPPAPKAQPQPSQPRAPSVRVERTPAPRPPTDTRSSALELIAEAQAELRAGRASHALSVLDEHARRFPQASTLEERQALRVLALCALERLAEGRGARAVFLKTHPDSPYAARVTRACVDPENR